MKPPDFSVFFLEETLILLPSLHSRPRAAGPTDIAHLANQVSRGHPTGGRTLAVSGGRTLAVSVRPQFKSLRDAESNDGNIMRPEEISEIL